MLLLEKGGKGKQSEQGAELMGSNTLTHTKSAALGLNHFYIIKSQASPTFKEIITRKQTTG